MPTTKTKNLKKNEGKIKPLDIEEDGISTFSSRLSELIGSGSVNGFALKCELSEATVRKYLKRESEPNLRNLVAIARTCNVSVEWLATGDETTKAHTQTTTPTNQQRERWLNVIDMMTPEEKNTALRNIARHGINMLLTPPQQQLAQPTESASDISMGARKMAELYDMADEDGKKYIQGLFDDVQRASSLDSNDKKRRGRG